MRAVQILVDGFAISCALWPRRRRLHADLRRLRRAQSRAWRHHGGGGDGRLGGGRRIRARHLRRDAGRHDRRAGHGLCDLSGRGAADPASRAIRPEETEIFVLTGTLLWGIMIQVGMAYLFSDNPVTIRPLIAGVVEHLRRAHADQ